MGKLWAEQRNGGARARRRRGALGALALLVASLGLAPSAEAAVVSSVQSGTAISSANGLLSVPITPVDPSTSFLVFETRHNSGRPVASMLRGRIAPAGDALEFVRVTNEAAPLPITVRWYVAEFSSGVSVQRGEVDQTATVIDVPLTPVAAVDQAFVTWSKTSLANHQNNLDGDDPILGELTATDNLQFRVDIARPGMLIWWQVIEFTSPTDIRVQKGSTSLTGGALSVDVNLAPADAVDVSSTFLLVGYQTSGSGNDIGARLLRAQLVDTDTIRIDRDIGGNSDDITEIVWQLVELRDGSEVIRGSGSLAAGVAQAAVGLGGRTVDPNGAVAFASVQPVGGQNMGKSPYDADDVPGVCSVTTELTPQWIVLDRDNTAESCDVGWFVVQFAPTATTAVTLTSFTATGLDEEVLLEWETGSEMDNLGFHLYRSPHRSGPWERVTESLIPGLGSSPEGAHYAYRDTGLENGRTYHYELEDVETTGRTTRHGPIAATPTPAAPPPPRGDPGPPAPGDPGSWVRYGTPEAASVAVVERDRRHAVVELRTGGFYALPEPDGGLRLWIPDFDETREPGKPALPVRRLWLEAVVGREVRIASVRVRERVLFDGLRPSIVGTPELWHANDGTIRVGVRRRRPDSTTRSPGLCPPRVAQVRQTAFQGDIKKAELELSPLGWDGAANRLALARHVLVRVEFVGRAEGEVALGGDSRGRAERADALPSTDGVLARLAVRDRGLYAVRYEDIFGAGASALSVPDVRLSRQGEAVASHVEPRGRRFGPGTALFFVSEGESLNPHGQEAVYELSVGDGLRMPSEDVDLHGEPLTHYQAQGAWERDVYYQPGLLQAEDLWQWDPLLAPATRSYPLDVSDLAGSSEPARLDVWLQGATDMEASPDHHVRVSVNDWVVGEASWDGEAPHRLQADVGPGILREGENLLQVENVGDTAAPYSLVLLDRYALRYPRALVAKAGILEGVFVEGGLAEIQGAPPASFVVDTTETPPRWVAVRLEASALAFVAEAGRRYLAVSPGLVLRPEVRPVRPSTLRSRWSRADYLVVGPREFLQAAEPLLELRRAQGLDSQAVAIEDVYDDFGFGESHPEAVRDFLGYAYHHWDLAPRYVLLLGDATYDFKGRFPSGTPNHVPPYLVRDTYLWTASDPTYAAVNGEDPLPDLAIGRLPAASLEEARRLIDKVVTWETSGLDLEGRAVLVADNSDGAGDFEGDAELVARTFLANRSVQLIAVSQLGGATRPTIRDAFDQGAALMSYLGHGGTAVWASANVWNNGDVATLSPQGQQPFLLTMDCLNGYFHNPTLNTLSEELLKAEGKGVIGVFSPSSLSVHWAARLYHEALIRELSSGRHERLGDALLAAQTVYADSGARVELLRTYHLLADPALRIR